MIDRERWKNCTGFQLWVSKAFTSPLFLIQGGDPPVSDGTLAYKNHSKYGYIYHEPKLLELQTLIAVPFFIPTLTKHNFEKERSSDTERSVNTERFCEFVRYRTIVRYRLISSFKSSGTLPHNLLHGLRHACSPHWLRHIHHYPMSCVVKCITQSHKPCTS